MTGTVLEEGLRGAGGWLLNGDEGALHAGATTRAASARRATSSRARSIRRCAPAAPRPTAACTSRCTISAPDNVRRQFKGMVERCADCGFDLAGGLVEVVPTAHYMMGGVVFGLDCTHATARPVRGRRGHRRRARRQPPRRQRRGQLDGVRRHRRRNAWRRTCAPAGMREPDEEAIAAQHRAARGALRPQRRRCSSAIREALYDMMWDDVGILRTAEGLERALGRARRTR